MNYWNWLRRREPITHDYTRRGWGHDYVYTPLDTDGLTASMMGWGHGIRKGDYLILQSGATGSRYEVTRIKYFSDPADMWDARVKFAPRTL